MKQLRQSSLFALGLIMGTAWLTSAQTNIGGSLSHRSSGSGFDNWTLSENCTVGICSSPAAPGSVTLSVNECSQRLRFRSRSRTTVDHAVAKLSRRVVAHQFQRHHSNPSEGRFHLSTATEAAPLFTYSASRVASKLCTWKAVVQSG